ncbi:HK97 family phage prohead protease [Methylobacterium sp. E-046]|uniref:HK97 family phage prohead protease n=1 Tax=Methylobacterium sp. E-046 TaxID=2836576 RepID=UPI001FB9E265|nr:HK97 family phage prohead protease [Methylobacterium sp. E-046]MCJ2102448.1 HK97 family phage prohead protease [Methylobacterium sp. E-046]
MATSKTGRRAAPGGSARPVDLKTLGARGRRFLEVAPASYDANEHTVEMILSEGSAVERWYGTERLSTDEAAVCIDRLATSGIPLLDSHNSYGLGAVLGRIVDVWFAEGRILGRAKFAATDAGKTIEGMVARGEVKGVSIGYRIDDWEITDAAGEVIDPETQNIWAFDDLTFTGKRWELLEASLVSVPADPSAMVRAHDAADGLGASPDLRSGPMGRGASEITVTRGDASITYRYGSTGPHERAWPEPREDKRMAKHTPGKNAPGKRQVRAEPTVDGYYVNDEGKYVDAEGNLVEEPVKAESRAAPTVDADGYYVNEDGDYVDAEGNKVEEPVKAERAAPEVDVDGNYVDGEGNYVDENGEPSEDPVKARDEDMDEARSAPRGRAASGKAGRATPAAGARGAKPGFSQAQASELASIANQARAHGVELNLASAIDRGLSPAAFRKIAFDKLAEKSKETAVRGSQPGSAHDRIQVGRDEREGRADAMTLALTSRVLASRGSDGMDYAPKRKAEKRWVEKHAARAESYMGMGFVEIAAECIGHRGNIRTSHQAIEIVERAFQSTSDFPAIFQNVLNKSLLARYELAEPTYKQISIERQFNDFRPHPQIRAGEFPMLQPVTQAGEIKVGKSADSGEDITLVPYGVIFPISRQMIVNDELGAIDQILGSSGDAVRLFENATFFAMFNANPVLKQDGTAVWHANHKNLAAAAGAITVANVGAGRAALRGMKSLSGFLLNVPPRIILTGPNQETSADQLVASITPQLSSSVNPFSGKLQSVSDANITDNSWTLLADPAQLPCFVHGFLNGSNGPRVKTFEPFGTQGVQISLEHDFACGAVDFRGAYRNPGALPQ